MTYPFVRAAEHTHLPLTLEPRSGQEIASSLELWEHARKHVLVVPAGGQTLATKRGRERLLAQLAVIS